MHTGGALLRLRLGRAGRCVKGKLTPGSRPGLHILTPLRGWRVAGAYVRAKDVLKWSG